MVTKKEALLSTIQSDVNDQDLEVALIKAGIDGTEPFTVADTKAIELAAIPVLQSLLVTTAERESQFSVTRSVDGIKERLLLIAKKYGLKDLESTLLRTPKISAARSRNGRRMW